jgi:predicted Holliday junction resolvase-like endonuclease
MSTENLIVVAVAFAVILLLVAICLFLLSRNHNLRVRHDDQVRDNIQLQQQVNAQVTANSQLQSHLGTLTQRRFEEWRERELEAVKKQLRDVAYSEARTMMEDWRQKWEATIRAQAISQSGAVITGRVTEQLAPYIGLFPYNPKDVRFIGSPIDLIVFDGMSEGALRRVIFLEVKTGNATLSTNQRQIRDALHQHRVEWGEFRMSN